MEDYHLKRCEENLTHVPQLLLHHYQQPKANSKHTTEMHGTRDQHQICEVHTIAMGREHVNGAPQVLHIRYHQTVQDINTNASLTHHGIVGLEVAPAPLCTDEPWH